MNHELLAELPRTPAAWMKDAACHERDVGLFFPATSEMPKAAVAVCAGCLVKAECLEYALTHNESNGVWGGLFAVQRRRLRVQRRREEKKSA